MFNNCAEWASNQPTVPGSNVAVCLKAYSWLKIIFNDQWNFFDTKIMHQDYACPENTKKAILLIPGPANFEAKLLMAKRSALPSTARKYNSIERGVCVKLRPNIKPSTSLAGTETCAQLELAGLAESC